MIANFIATPSSESIFPILSSALDRNHSIIWLKHQSLPQQTLVLLETERSPHLWHTLVAFGVKAPLSFLDATVPAFAAVEEKGRVRSLVLNQAQSVTTAFWIDAEIAIRTVCRKT